MSLDVRALLVGAAAVLVALVGCAPSSSSAGTPSTPTTSTPTTSTPTTSTPTAVPTAPATQVPAACEDVLAESAVRGLLGGVPEVGGGKPRVTGTVTSTRCDWLAPNGRYLTIITLEGPGLPARARTVAAGATPVPGRPGISYDPARGLIVTVEDRLHQVVAGGAGTAQARVIGLKAVELIRAGAD